MSTIMLPKSWIRQHSRLESARWERHGGSTTSSRPLGAAGSTSTRDSAPGSVASLQAASGLSLSDYEILVALTDEDVPEHSLRMFELGERLQWEKSRVSKQVSRMEARGLVERRHCADDRRGAFVDLTEAGHAAIAAAAPSHVDLVREPVLRRPEPRAGARPRGLHQRRAGAGQAPAEQAPGGRRT
ncbi:MarR family winged helix-turn-helix transcriptional regulator [Nocardioides convexus]|uniref:MarR family winged helix-turn-helix transcriptional regulator n=1 Tax=Nocardioides convexus TaxID=2712224 RepID=UPI00241849A9|nr:MarR family winged helix-turn-helix transcriptional regulator [Nocardioides convexus]